MKGGIAFALVLQNPLVVAGLALDLVAVPQAGQLGDRADQGRAGEGPAVADQFDIALRCRGHLRGRRVGDGAGAAPCRSPGEQAERHHQRHAGEHADVRLSLESDQKQDELAAGGDEIAVPPAQGDEHYAARFS
ncbi:MAG: hypothetical protein M5R42_06910 [Rhodocyclaceae bacterium]|nr:hypothetical protein [Rhodocyclaceae bacterium]